MKTKILAALVAVAAFAIVGIAIAAPPVETTIAVNAQPTLWTNAYQSAIHPVRFDFSGWSTAMGAGDTVTVRRIRGIRTNDLVTSFAFTTGGGGTAWLSETNYLYLVKGDVIRISGILLPTGTVNIVSTQP